MDMRLSPRRVLGTAVLALCLWVLHDFLQGLLAACAIAVASWPLYERFRRRMPGWIGSGAAPLLFTAVVTVFVLAPMLLALGALLGEASGLLRDIAALDRNGIAVPPWLQDLPLLGPWAAERWQAEISHPLALLGWAQRTNPTALLGWVQSLGQFTLRQVLVVGFAVLLVYFLFCEGDALARGVRQWLAGAIGEDGGRYLDLVTRGVRASVHGMFAVALFDGLLTWLAYTAGGAPHPAVWAGITGLLAAVPFLGYVALLGLCLRMALAAPAAAVVATAALGCLVLLVGDKVVRPAVTRSGLRLPFAWVLLGCVGGFETMGLVGLVGGPVVLTLAAEMWRRRGRAPAH